MSATKINTLKKLFGEGGLKKLEKAEIFKPQTGTATDLKDIQIGLQIVPRYVLSFLFQFKELEDGGSKERFIPWEPKSSILINRLGPDIYSGYIVRDGKKVVNFEYRSLPAVGIIVMSTFELYDTAMLREIKTDSIYVENDNRAEKESKIQEIIDERLRIHSLINEVVEQKISRYNAINQLIAEKALIAEEKYEPKKEEKEMGKKLKLKEYLEKKNNELKSIKCPDCDTEIYKSEDDYVKCCICYGEFKDKNIKVMKGQNGVKLHFPKNFEEENILMLIEALNNLK